LSESADSGEPADSTSAIKSENDFGSSSQVPGAADEGESGEADADDRSEGAASNADGGDDSSAGSGRSTSPSDAANQVGPAVAASVAAEPDGLRTGLLIGLAALLAVGVGLLARRGQRFG